MSILTSADQLAEQMREQLREHLKRRAAYCVEAAHEEFDGFPANEEALEKMVERWALMAFRVEVADLLLTNEASIPGSAALAFERAVRLEVFRDAYLRAYDFVRRALAAA